ncbi:MAG TPA: DinB family protein [Thermoplasmata archaeon]|nr:DinB family protein [Thermoplasmata archaeon]
MPVAFVRGIQAYDRAVFDRFQRSAERRGWAAAVRDRGTGHLSVKNTLVHILNVQEAWLVGIAQKRWAVFDDPARTEGRIRAWRDLRAYRDRPRGAIDPWMRRLTAPELRRRVRAPWMPGRYTVEDAFLQASYEQAHHLGEIIAVYWQSEWSPPPMTWIENLPTRGG